MLGLYIRAALASSNCDSKEKRWEIHREKIDTHGSHIVHFAMSHMRNEI